MEFHINMIWFYITLICLSSIPLPSRAIDKPELSDPSSKELGMTASFTCSYSLKKFGANSTPMSLLYLAWKRGGAEIVRIANLVQPDTTYNTSFTGSNKRITADIQFTQPYPEISSTLTISRMECGDENTYTCFISGSIKTGNVFSTATSFSSKQLLVTKQPGIPGVTYKPAAIVEMEPVQFTCQVNVGRPKGTIHMYRSDSKPIQINTTPQVDALAVDKCSFEANATATLRFNRTQRGSVVTCRVYYDGRYTSLDANTLPLKVQYLLKKVSITFKVFKLISVTNDTKSHEVMERDRFTLSCESDSHPLATYVWEMKRDGAVLMTWTKQDINLVASKDRAGLYYCTATNELTDGRSSSKTSLTVNITVIDRPTTVEPPTTSTQTTTNKEGPTVGPSGSSGPDSGIIAGAVVGTIAAIALIIIIAFVCLKRRNNRYKNAEDSSNKPANNQNVGSLYKETEPDLWKSHKQPSTPGNLNTGYNRQDDYLNHIPMSTEGRSRHPVMLNENPYKYNSPYPDTSLHSEYSHSRPV